MIKNSIEAIEREKDKQTSCAHRFLAFSPEKREASALGRKRNKKKTTGFRSTRKNETTRGILHCIACSD
jgi:hypothetical protein